uniref:Integrase, catalytic region, zinc finger, CCHC-type, peptidase aspartic, catalytic n=1 Tax=Tanacetum cinerariifolium TaxID=118510 RepID=A0A699H6J8_TANCI|nr:integrase, catalytic region, zinc finger, CCHC-type, peptidase aspartic, catalytic [Tanacetum cinerariifolium]
MTLQEHESKLYDEFDRFTSDPGESIRSYYFRYAKLINEMNIIKMSMSKMQINMKFVNHLQPEWSSTRSWSFLHEEQQEFLADKLKENDDCDDLQLHITANFKADLVDSYDSDCDDEATASAIFMASLPPADQSMIT